ncbi:Asp-tRNA(Asn)/Glu-tRNA(Gln) amidotransferase subunit GatB [[Mycoplasma] anseris]|uniref:Aspartyl/glutamyl-tRNA(Asn/Gln) amidotransferase subunit B n=1 Tax=[Mycoplasma] anseris TaxID=92400 RepID=A0A2Z4NCT7_9BACT|nr:Asp-tRNA(Asn)/Glu-tRNA(Gln) amidotransferase subunit GatB [[Mycoplasma] anseris]AWX69372.1 Asp-tRNA(Asn)/Glu-tRNA(Gln) amidotransferase subunit GatB [[Mycoplasma] anseris]
MNSDWEMVIGIEIHLELNTKTKMFSPAPNTYNAKENTCVSNIDLAYPGTLPLINSQAIIKGIKLAKALHMEIDHEIHFDRKNYFYPDLNKGYQITQQFRPIGKNGSIKIKVKDQWKEVLIERIHLEEDTAKSVHENGKTYLNQNRAGVPLIEIVSNPVIHSAEEAIAYVEAIRQTALALNISEAKMNEGSLRTDVNISVRKKNTTALNTRVEIKNLNSLSNIEKAIQSEFNYQVNAYLNHETFEQTTKRFDEATEQTIVMRSKADSIDYKYFPDPNLPFVRLSNELIDSVSIEEIPYEKEIRYQQNGLNNVQISQLLNNIDYANYLDQIAYEDLKKSANIFFAEIVTFLNKNNIAINEFWLSPKEAKELITLLVQQKINKTSIATLIELKKSTKESIFELANKHNLIIEQIKISLEEIIEKVLEENLGLKDQFTTNFDKASKFMLGQVMKKTMGKANVAELNKILKDKFN